MPLSKIPPSLYRLVLIYSLLDDFQCSRPTIIAPGLVRGDSSGVGSSSDTCETEIYQPPAISRQHGWDTIASEPGASAEHQRKAKAHILSKMAQNQVGVNLGKGMADPYVPVLAVTLGATAPQLGWLLAFINLFPAVMQVPWGKLSDVCGRRIPFSAIGGVMSFSLYFFLIGVADAWQLIIIVAIQMLIGSMMIPTWSALVGDVTTVKDRGSVMGRFFAISSFASLVGTLFAGAIIPPENATLEDFAVPFFVAGGSGIIGSLVLYEIAEEKRRLFASPKTLFPFSIKLLIFFNAPPENKYYRTH